MNLIRNLLQKKASIVAFAVIFGGCSSGGNTLLLDVPLPGYEDTLPAPILLPDEDASDTPVAAGGEPTPPIQVPSDPSTGPNAGGGNPQTPPAETPDPPTDPSNPPVAPNAGGGNPQTPPDETPDPPTDPNDPSVDPNTGGGMSPGNPPPDSTAGGGGRTPPDETPDPPTDPNAGGGERTPPDETPDPPMDPNAGGGERTPPDETPEPPMDPNDPPIAPNAGGGNPQTPPVDNDPDETANTGPQPLDVRDPQAYALALNEIRTNVQFTRQPALRTVGADVLIARGATGDGVTVGIIDDGIPLGRIRQPVDPNDPSAGERIAGYGEFADTTFTYLDSFVLRAGTPNEVTIEYDITRTSSRSSHGSSVASIIAARDNDDGSRSFRGIAPGVTLRDIPLINIAEQWCENNERKANCGLGYFYALLPAIQDATENVHVANISNALTCYRTLTPGSSNSACPHNNVRGFSDISRALLQSTKSSIDKTVFVFAAGNDRLVRDSDGNLVNDPAGGVRHDPDAANPFSIQMFPEDVPDLTEVMITVVATDDAGQISSYSNRCGEAADWCIAAPGNNLRIYTARMVELGLCGAGATTCLDEGYSNTSGTSFAAPLVTGGLAGLYSLFEGTVPMVDLLIRIKETATDTGRWADSSIYGHGLLNLDAASNPVGPLALATGEQTVNDGGTPVNQGLLDSTFSGAIALATSLAEYRLMTFDSFGAPFWYRADSLVSQCKNVLCVSDNRGALQVQQREQSDSSSVSYATASPLTLRTEVQHFAQEDKGLHYHIALGNAPADWLFQGPQSYKGMSPWSSYITGLTAVGLDIESGGGLIQLGACIGSHNQNPYAGLSIGLAELKTGDCATAGYSKSGEQHGYTLRVGYDNQFGGLLGLNQAVRGLGNKTRTHTQYLGGEFRQDLNTKLSLIAGAWIGAMQWNGNNSTLLVLKDTVAQKATLSLVGKNLFTNNDSLIMQLDSQLRLQDPVTLRLPVSRTKAGEVIYHNIALNDTVLDLSPRLSVKWWQNSSAKGVGFGLGSDIDGQNTELLVNWNHSF